MNDFVHSSFFRFLSVFLAILLGFFVLISFPVSASAESLVIDGQTCATMNGYPIIGVEHFNNSSLVAVRNKYTQCSIFLVCSYNGDFYIPSNSYVPQLNIHGSSGSYIYFYGFGSTGDTSLCPYPTTNSNYESWLEKICANVVVSSDSVTVSYGSRSASITKLYDFNGNVADSINPTDCIYYWAVNPYFTWTSNSGAMKTASLISSSDGSGYVPAHLEQTAKFLKLVDSTADSKLNICDWMRAGYQYPIVDFQINDNKNNDSYVLKVGSNSTKTDLMKQLYSEDQVKDALSGALNFSGAAIGINFRPSTADALKNIKLMNALTNCDTWDYDTVTTISSDLFSFNDPEVLSSIYSVCLSDYLSIVPYNIYRLDIVSQSSSKILSTCYFTSERAFSRGNSGYGVKVYTYGSVEDANSDSSNNDYSNKPPTTTGNIADSTNVSDFVSNNFNNSLSNLDISSTFGSFESALNSVSSFFQACWGFFPAEIWAIILCGISLIIILRVLGR